MANSSSLGQRLLEAFGTDDKDEIAKILGFASKQSIYKIISGERELDFDRLKIFRDYTKRSIDWLLTGDDPPVPQQAEDGLVIRIREIVREELRAGGSVERDEVSPIEPVTSDRLMQTPVIAHIGPGIKVPSAEDSEEEARTRIAEDLRREESSKRQGRKTG